ncbi:MAG: hypothetical protein JWM76_884 [Pseudonocardiales bacterium]|nr:hypothetical protein [Pseudonocardiales bacterium]
MSVHQCPKCELRFTWQTELDAHCNEDHPDFHHEYKTHSWELKHPQTPSPPPPSRT